MKSVEIQLNEALAASTTKDAEIAALQNKLNENLVATAKLARTTILKESKLPAPCVIRLDAAFAKSADNAGLQEAINVEKDYVKSLGVKESKTVVTNNGEQVITENGGQKTDAEIKESQKKFYKSIGLSDAAAKKAAGIE